MFPSALFRALIPRLRRLAGLWLLLLSALCLGRVARADNYPVTSLNDSGSGTLRDAITQANAHAGADTITFNVGGVITLTSALPYITDAVSIDGTGFNVAVARSSDPNTPAFTVFSVISGATSGPTVSITSVTISNGLSQGNTGVGGGIFSIGALTLTNCTLSGNSSEFGGGICSLGSLTMNNCTLSGNSASFGGGVFCSSAANSGASATLSHCTLTNNTSTDFGGGFSALAGMNSVVGVTLSDCQFLNNSAQILGGGAHIGASDNGKITLTVTSGAFNGNVVGSAANKIGGGGGVACSATPNSSVTLNMDGCGFQNNSAAAGGGLFSEDDVAGTINNCSFKGNNAVNGGGIFNVRGTGNVANSTYSNCDVRANFANQDGGGVFNTGLLIASGLTIFGNGVNGNGGDLSNSGAAILTNSAITGGFAFHEGGGINNTGSALLTNCSVVGSFATDNGGGISSSGVLELTNSTLALNQTQGDGGGLFVGGQGAILSRCTLYSNLAANGGGLRISSAQSLITYASTFSGNQATGKGGAIYNSAIVQSFLCNSTFYGNTAAQGGGFYDDAPGRQLIVTDNIFAGSANGNLVFEHPGIMNYGYNLADDDGGGMLTDANDILNTNPLLGPLQDNGGLTLTHALASNSPAINKGRNLIGSLLDGLYGGRGDQRGFTRPVVLPGIPNAPGGDGSDIGAFEVQFAPRVIVTNIRAARVSANTVSVTFTLQDTGNGVAPNVKVASARLRTQYAASLPAAFTLMPGASQSVTLTFTSASAIPSGTTPFVMSGSYIGGTFSSGLNIAVPQ